MSGRGIDVVVKQLISVNVKIQQKFFHELIDEQDIAYIQELILLKDRIKEGEASELSNYTTKKNFRSSFIEIPNSRTQKSTRDLSSRGVGSIPILRTKTFWLQNQNFENVDKKAVDNIVVKSLTVGTAHDTK